MNPHDGKADGAPVPPGTAVEEIAADATAIDGAAGGGRVGIDRLIAEHAALLSAKLRQQRSALWPAGARKTLRRFTSGEVARLLGVNDAYLRRLHLDGRGPQPEIRPGGRRLYTPEDIQRLRVLLEAGARQPGAYLPHRRPGEHLQAIAVINFKGGAGKTTTAAHFAQRGALGGYRVLALDLDPQASLTTLFGLQPELDLAGGTLLEAIRHEAPRPLAEVIQPTYFAGLDLVPGNLELMEFEHEVPRALMRGEGGLFFTRLADRLAEVEDRYDLVVMDCPPQLGFLTLSALSAATAMLVTVHPQMLDVMSMCQFLHMTADLLGVVAEAGGDTRLDWLRYVMTRHEPGDGPQAQMAGFLRALFGGHVLTNAALKSTAIADAGITNQTLYEVERGAFNRLTYERALESVEAVNAEILGLVHAAWGRAAA